VLFDIIEAAGRHGQSAQLAELGSQRIARHRTPGISRPHQRLGFIFRPAARAHAQPAGQTVLGRIETRLDFRAHSLRESKQLRIIESPSEKIARGDSSPYRHEGQPVQEAHLGGMAPPGAIRLAAVMNGACAAGRNDFRYVHRRQAVPAHELIENFHRAADRAIDGIRLEADVEHFPPLTQAGVEGSSGVPDARESAEKAAGIGAQDVVDSGRSASREQRCQHSALRGAPALEAFCVAFALCGVEPRALRAAMAHRLAHRSGIEPQQPSGRNPRGVGSADRVCLKAALEQAGGSGASDAQRDLGACRQCGQDVASRRFHGPFRDGERRGHDQRGNLQGAAIVYGVELEGMRRAGVDQRGIRHGSPARCSEYCCLRGAGQLTCHPHEARGPVERASQEAAAQAVQQAVLHPLDNRRGEVVIAKRRGETRQPAGCALCTLRLFLSHGEALWR
jgi:hypothetical protein